MSPKTPKAILRIILFLFVFEIVGLMNIAGSEALKISLVKGGESDELSRYLLRESYQVPDIAAKPIIFLTRRSNKSPVPGEGEPFYVLIENTGNSPITLRLLTSEWFDCLSLLITHKNGTSNKIVRLLGDFAKNTSEPWTILGHQARIIPIDLSDGTWVGLPEKLGSPEVVRVTVTFQHIDAKEKSSITSDETDAILVPKWP